MKKESYKTKEGTLYIVSTPIGNLKDITLRALDTLNEVNIIACEDTRVTRKLLTKYNIAGKKLISYGNHNLKEITSKLVMELQSDKSIALVSDAGTPLISDPGSELVQECYNKNIKVTTVPGACSVISSLTLCGVSNGNFYFGGFLESKSSLLEKQLIKAKSINSLLVFFCAANKLNKSLEIIIKIFGESQNIIITRELTKLFEEVINSTAIALKNKLLSTKLLGEVVMLIPNKVISKAPSLDELEDRIRIEIKTSSIKDAIIKISKEYNSMGVQLNKKELYNIALLLKNNDH